MGWRLGSRLVALLLGLAVPALGTAAEVALNRLNACDDIAAITRALNAGLGASRDECRATSGPIDRGIRKAFGAVADQTCFLRQVPRQALQDFSCLRTKIKGSPSLTCYRPVPETSIRDYKALYEKRYATAAAQYLSQASQCPASNGDTTYAPATMFAPLLTPVATFEFAFASQLGSSRPGDGLVVHGFATASPELAGAGVQALEYVSYATGLDLATYNAALNRTRLGHWRLKIADGGEQALAFERQARRQGGSLIFQSLDIGMLRAPDAPPPARAGSVTEALSAKAVQELGGEGFEALSEADLERYTGMDSQQMLAEVGKKAPFGAKDVMDRVMVNPRVTVLIKSRVLACTQNKRGAFAAYVIRSDGEPGVQADFGSIGIMVLGLGACGRSIEANRGYVRELLAQTRQVLLDELQAR